MGGAERGGFLSMGKFLDCPSRPPALPLPPLIPARSHLQMHLVHASEDGALMVVAVLLKIPETADADDDTPFEPGASGVRGKSDNAMLATLWGMATRQAEYAGMAVGTDDEVAVAVKDEWQVKNAATPLNPYALIQRPAGARSARLEVRHA